jgi:hypothetical protein
MRDILEIEPETLSDALSAFFCVLNAKSRWQDVDFLIDSSRFLSPGLSPQVSCGGYGCVQSSGTKARLPALSSCRKSG